MEGDTRGPVTSLEAWAPPCWERPGEQWPRRGGGNGRWGRGRVGPHKALGLQTLNEAKSKDVREVYFSDFTISFQERHFILGSRLWLFKSPKQSQIMLHSSKRLSAWSTQNICHCLSTHPNPGETPGAQTSGLPSRGKAPATAAPN